MNQATYYTIMPSPIDDLLLVSDGNALTGLYMEQTRDGRAVEAAWKRDPGPFREVVRQLLAYFEGELRLLVLAGNRCYICQFAEYLYRFRGIFCWKGRGFQGEGGDATTSGGIMAG
jgi:hypothetical protein